jgi:flagellar biosynthesis protein FlhG
MKQIDETTHYDLLGVMPNAGLDEIHRAYTEVRAIYDTDSLCTYSLFSGPEREKITKRIQTAFQTLIDPFKRCEYDQFLMSAGRLTDTDREQEKQKSARPIFSETRSEWDRQKEKRIKEKLNNAEITTLKEKLNQQTSISGSQLRQLRGEAGVTLTEINELSKISIQILEAIEEDRKSNLPAPVYLKGFLKSYAECLCLDARTVVPAYLNHLEIGSP